VARRRPRTSQRPDSGNWMHYAVLEEIEMLKKVTREEMPEMILRDEFGRKNPNLLHNVEPLPITTEEGELVDYYVHNWGARVNQSPDQEKWHNYYHFQGTVTLEEAITKKKDFRTVGYCLRHVSGSYRLYRLTRGLYLNTAVIKTSRYPRADVRRIPTTQHEEYICDTELEHLVDLVEKLLER